MGDYQASSNHKEVIQFLNQLQWSRETSQTCWAVILEEQDWRSLEWSLRATVLLVLDVLF